VADWLSLRRALKDRFRNIENYTPSDMSGKDAEPNELAGSIISALAAVGYGRRLIRELEKEWKKAEYAPERTPPLRRGRCETRRERGAR